MSETGFELSPLGAPMGISEVALLIGCSPWSVRQTHLRKGLPYLRSGPNGKLIFYHDQVVRWVLEQQKRKEANIQWPSTSGATSGGRTS
jgi:hypothetical protein